MKRTVWMEPWASFALGMAISLLILGTTAASAVAEALWPRITLSRDGTPISYEVHGEGESTLVLVHGWSCDGRYWREQLSHFSRSRRVVTLDLAGHGHSGMQRSRYTMRAFGEDIQAVTEAAGGRKVILIGHSMGGSVIAEAARLMPDRVIGLIGVDTLENVEYAMTREAVVQMTAPLKRDFRTGVRAFVEGMFYPDTAPRLREWILSDMAAAPPAVALSAMEEMMEQYVTGEAARMFEEIPLPVVVVKGDLWPVDPEANRRHMASFDVLVIEGADHFLMMNRPEAFNRALEEAIDWVSTGGDRPWPVSPARKGGQPMLLKALGLWLVILAAAVANAALREKVLASWLGSGPSLPLSGLILSGFILLFSCVSMPFIGSSSEAVYHQVGLIWFVSTFSFELLMGRILMKKPWREIRQVFDLKKGDLFSLVLVATLVSPRLAAELRGLT